MSPQETQALQDFLHQLTQVRGVVKDPQADTMIAAAVALQPDAAYLLVQRALLMDQALTASKAQIASLQHQVQALQAGVAPSSGFLDGNAWGQTPVAPVRPNAAPAFAPAYAPAVAPAQAVAQSQAAAPSPGLFGGGMGSMLGTVAATAAGVAGGAFLFQGIEHLMGSGSRSGFMSQDGWSKPVENIENTTINNYGGSSGDSALAQGREDGVNATGSDNDLSDLANMDLDDSGDDFFV